MPFPDFFEGEYKTFKSKEELKKLYSAVDPSREVTFTCGVGISAACGAFVLDYIEHPSHITLYDGSWQEYSKYKIPDFSNPAWELTFTKEP